MYRLVDGARGATRFSDLVQGAIAALAYFRDEPQLPHQSVVLTIEGRGEFLEKVMVEIHEHGRFAGFLRSAT